MREDLLDGNARFELLEIDLVRVQGPLRTTAYRGKRYWLLSDTMSPLRRAALMANWAVRLEDAVRCMRCSRNWL